jgi:3-dehydroquinate synthase
LSGNLSFDVCGTRTDIIFQPQPHCPEATVTVFDSNTNRLFGSDMVPLQAGSVVLPAGELSKSWQSVEAVLERCVGLSVGRDSMIAGVGGGVICDIAALAASLYMRGCALTLVPTTLLAMVDASFGGKTGIDFMGYKNLVGSFYPASRIVIAPSAVRTLPDREYLSGLAEVIKTALIGDTELFALLDAKRDAVKAREPMVVEEMIHRSLAVKGRIVEADPKERGERALLNLGHTFGHALESASGFAGWTHGEAVAWGMGRALALGISLGITDAGFAAQVTSMLAAYGFRLRAPVGYRDLAPAMARDKKRRQGRVRVVIPCGPGDVRLREVDERELSMALEDGAL